ncbi:MAG: hypothetical protein HY917_04140 [Candidatus Diapherotrites archaeon]|nr:hypothetical protein [Candidatus Diapherotrites archaeon]
MLRKNNCTSILISEILSGKKSLSRFNVEEFVSDGVVALYFSPPNRSIFIRKMRGTNHSKKVHPFSIGNTGIVINPKDEMLWDAIK